MLGLSAISAIMQEFRDSNKINNNKKKIKLLTGSHFGFFSVKFVMGNPCVRHYILFYIYGPVILHFLSKYYKIQCLIPKVIRSLADIAEHICLIKRRSDGNFFLKRTNKHFFVSGHSN